MPVSKGRVPKAHNFDAKPKNTRNTLQKTLLQDHQVVSTFYKERKIKSVTHSNIAPYLKTV